jgi:hypothetical protein
VEWGRVGNPHAVCTSRACGCPTRPHSTRACGAAGPHGIRVIRVIRVSSRPSVARR